MRRIKASYFQYIQIQQDFNNNNDILEYNIIKKCIISRRHKITLACVAVLAITLTLISFEVPWLFTPCQYNMKTANEKENINGISTIAFGSCINGMHPIPIFDDIQADVLVFLGDNIYADTQQLYYMHWMYNRLSCKIEFWSLLNRVKYVLAIWDDHDFGNDNVGSDYPRKFESQSIFLDFFKIPSNSERRRGKGVYGSYKFNVADSNQTVTIILPDLRFFRDPLKLCENGEYFPRDGCFCPTNRSLLGDVQWIWLENVVKKSQNEDSLTIIASSTQYGHSANGYESWTNFPVERTRLRRLLDPSKSLVISGDVHWGEISMYDGLIDATSSGFTEVDPNIISNSNRIGNAMTQQNYGFIDLQKKTVSIYGLGNKKLLSASWGLKANLHSTLY
jgi:alkaline phosphatase D